MKISADTLKVIPIIWIAVMTLVLITHKPAEWLTAGIIKEEDSFGSHMIMEPIQMFFCKWPRNAAISFIIEAFIAQAIARFVMLKLHQNADSIEEQA